MFDTYVSTKRETIASHHHTTHEHRAPTDQSVALLREMEQAAEDKVVARIKSGPNDFQFGALIFDHGIYFDGVEIRVRFRLGEMQHQFKLEMERGMEQKKYITAIRDAIAEKIATVICVANAEVILK